MSQHVVAKVSKLRESEPLWKCMKDPGGVFGGGCYSQAREIVTLHGPDALVQCNYMYTHCKAVTISGCTRH